MTIKRIANIAEMGQVEEHGIQVLDVSSIQKLAGNCTPRNLARISLAFLSVDGLNGDDMVELTLWGDLAVTKDWKDVPHHPGWDSYFTRVAQTGALLVKECPNSVRNRFLMEIFHNMTNRRIDSFRREVSRQLHRKAEFDNNCPCPCIFWR